MKNQNGSAKKELLMLKNRLKQAEDIITDLLYGYGVELCFFDGDATIDDVRKYEKKYGVKLDYTFETNETGKKDVDIKPFPKKEGEMLVGLFEQWQKNVEDNLINVNMRKYFKELGGVIKNENKKV